MIDFNPTISIDTLNVNDLKKNVKIQQFSGCIKKQDPNICYLSEMYFKFKDIYR